MPESSPGRVTLFKAGDKLPSLAATNGESRKTTARLAEQWRAWRADPTLGWGRLAERGVEINRVPGHHFNMVRQPHVAVLADKLRTRILETAR